MALFRDPWLTGVRIRITLRSAGVQIRRVSRILGQWLAMILERVRRIHARDESIGVGFHPVRQSLTVVLLLGTLAYGCSSVTREAPPPSPFSEDGLRAYPMGPPLLEDLAEEPAPAVTMVEHRRPDDSLRASPMLDDPDFLRAVDSWDAYWRGNGRRWFPIYLDRMAGFSFTVDSALVEHGLPGSLRYLPLIESGYSPRATSRVGAVGLWQLMPPTARTLGLQVTPLLDERRDPIKATHAAMRFIKDLNREFDSWFLTLAAYNAGPGRVKRILDFHAPGEPYTDSLFWALRDFFPEETQDFVPKFYSAMRAADDPEAYGFRQPRATPLRFDEVYVPGLTSLDLVARAAGVSYDDVVNLNPHYVRGVTPPDHLVPVRLPWGRGPTFAQVEAGIGGGGANASERLVLANVQDSTGLRLLAPDGDRERAAPALNRARPAVSAPVVVPLAPPGSDPMR
jgi:hypothetical protein